MGACVSSICSFLFSLNKVKNIDGTPERNQTIEEASVPRTRRDQSIEEFGNKIDVSTDIDEESINEDLFIPGGRKELAFMPNGYGVSNDINLTLNEITMALTRPDIITLGVYGSSNRKMGDVVERITRRVKRDNLFDLIVRAHVTKKPDLKTIQGELGNMLGLQLREKNLEGRAHLLCGRIKMTSKILIILDDVRGEINLGKIGIPIGNDHNGCKILLISETQNVLTNHTNAQIEFTV